MSKEFVKRYGDDFVGWLYIDRNIDQLKALCIDPVITTEGDIITIKFNVLSNLGAVECRTLYGKYVDDHISIENLTISVLKPTGTYYYGIVG